MGVWETSISEQGARVLNWGCRIGGDFRNYKECGKTHGWGWSITVMSPETWEKSQVRQGGPHAVLFGRRSINTNKGSF